MLPIWIQSKSWLLPDEHIVYVFMDQFCIEFQDREDEIAPRQASLFNINSSGAKLMQSPNLTDDDRKNIQRDIDNLNAGWKKVCLHLVISDFPGAYFISCVCKVDISHLSGSI